MVFSLCPEAVRIAVATDHWLICPTHVLWRYDGVACDERRCLRCTLAHGRPPSRTGTIEAPIGRDLSDIGRMAVDGRHSRPAITHFELAEALPTTTLLRVRLETGRTHQIRVHLAAIGHGVMGDPTYGIAARHLGLQRQFLHAAELAFEHPASGEPMRFTSALPDDLEAALVLARAL